MKRISIDEKNWIKSLLKSGLIGDEIAEKTGRSTATISKIRKEIETEGFDIWHNAGVVSRGI